MRFLDSSRGLQTLFVLLALALGISSSASAQSSPPTDGAAAADARRAYIPTSADGATASADVDGTCVACEVIDLDAVVSPRVNAPATIRLPANVAGSVRLRVDLASAEPERSRAGFLVVDRTGALDLAAFERVTVRTYANATVRDQETGTAALVVQALGGDRYSVTLQTTKSFNAIELEVGSTAESDTRFDVLYAAVVRPQTVEQIVALASEGGRVRGGTSGACAGCAVDRPARVIDPEVATAAEMRIPVGVDGRSYVAVAYGQPLPAEAWTGFLVSSTEDLLDASVLGELTLTAYRGGEVVAQASGADLRVSQNDRGLTFVRFRVPETFSVVRIEAGALVSVDFELNVHAALTVPTSDALGLAEARRAAVAPADVAPSGVSLGVPSPNPFRSATRLTVTLDEAGPVRAVAYDALGREAAVLYEGTLSAGAHALALDGAGLSSGSYVIRVAGPSGASAHRLVTVAR